MLSKSNIKLIIRESDILGRRLSVELKVSDIGNELFFLTLEKDW